MSGSAPVGISAVAAVHLSSRQGKERDVDLWMLLIGTRKAAKTAEDTWFLTIGQLQRCSGIR